LEDGEAVQDEGEYEKESNDYVCDKQVDSDKGVFVITDSDPIWSGPSSEKCLPRK
jgi:hypothetical protein